MNQTVKKTRISVTSSEIFSIAKTFQSIMKSTALMEEVKAELHLSESASSLKGKVITSSENESEIINVAVQDHDPAKALRLRTR